MQVSGILTSNFMSAMRNKCVNERYHKHFPFTKTEFFDSKKITEYLFFFFSFFSCGERNMQFLDCNNFYASIKVVLDQLYEPTI